MQAVGPLRFIPYQIISSFPLLSQVELLIDLKIVLFFTLKKKKRQVDCPSHFCTESSMYINMHIHKMHQILT